jgi:maleylacetate reductase
LLVSTPGQRDKAQAIAEPLERRIASHFAHATMHTPVEVTEAALAEFRDVDADGVLAFGGGTAVGLAKAIALHTGCRQAIVATTYAGSEVTPVLGQTAAGMKTTMRDPRLLPDLVLYDPALTLDLPLPTSITSGFNAIAHAVEALYAPDRNPVSSLMALEGARAMVEALPRIAADPLHLPARTRALYSAWLCGTVLGAVGMSLHHKLPHAGRQLRPAPCRCAYRDPAARAGLQHPGGGGGTRPLAQALGDDPAQALHRLARELGAPTSLARSAWRKAISTAPPRWPRRTPTPTRARSNADRSATCWRGRGRESNRHDRANHQGARRMSYFTEAQSAEAVNARLGADIDPRLARIMRSLVTHLHAFIKDVELTGRNGPARSIS